MDILLVIFLSGTPISTLPAASAYDCEKSIVDAEDDILTLLAPFPHGIATADGSIHRAVDYSVKCVPATEHLLSLPMAPPA